MIDDSNSLENMLFLRCRLFLKSRFFLKNRLSIQKPLLLTSPLNLGLQLLDNPIEPHKRHITLKESADNPLPPEQSESLDTVLVQPCPVHEECLRQVNSQDGVEDQLDDRAEEADAAGMESVDDVVRSLRVRQPGLVTLRGGLEDTGSDGEVAGEEEQDR